MNTPTLGDKLGLPPRASPLLRKAAALGLPDAAKLEALAVARGCWHYSLATETPLPAVPETVFNNEELAIALLSPSLPYSPRSIRLGAAMLGAEGNAPSRLAILATEEGSETAVRYVANAAQLFERDLPFWRELLAELPRTAEPPDGVFPHPTRFVEMTGIDRGKVGRSARWIRPHLSMAA